MAEPREIIEEVEALTVHCRPPLMPVDQRSRWQQDWVQDLKTFPLAAIQSAFREWRHSENTKFPTPGQIIPMVRRFSGVRENAPESVEPWTYEISDDNYRSLSLSAKIRHHRIAAAHCRTQAGPMPHPGPAVHQEDMPEVWHAWRRRAEKHDAEAAKLRKTLSEYEQRA